MQAAGQYGEVPQYVASRVGASHGHLFNLSHDMSLSSSSATPGQAHAHGHGLSLSHPPAHTQASQSHITSASTQPSFLQSQHQQQHVQHGFSVNMGGVPPKTLSTPPPASHPLAQTPQSTQALQSAAQQLQADIKQHQQQQLHHVPQTTAHDLGVLKTQQQATSSDPVQLARQKDQPLEAQGNTGGGEIVPSTEVQVLVATPNKTTREETSGDGEEVDEEGERGGGGNRWPRQEALALLKIRSEMDAAFRDSSLKGPLWEEISRKLAEMGYHRSAKKCKEKFENVHKYYKRTKEGKTGRQDGKSYRFFTQLEALYGKAGDTTSLINLNNSKSPNQLLHTNTAVGSNTIAHSCGSGGLLISLNGDTPATAHAGLNLTAANHTPLNNFSSSNISGPVPLASFPPFNSTSAAAAHAAAAKNAHIARTLERVESMKREPVNTTSQYFFDDSDDNDDDEDFDDDEEDDDDGDQDDELDEPAGHETAMPAAATTVQNTPRGKKRKRKSLKKYLIFFEKIMKKVIDKQEHMQQKFLEALERRDQDRMIREEAWKRQEMVRLNREQDVRAAERAISASRDASLVAFLQKMTGQSITLPHPTSSIPVQTHNHHSSAIVPADYLQNESNADIRDGYDPSSKRWPKPEVLALIKLRTSLDQRFHEPGSKAVLWEEISAAMSSQGYARTAKRCKEKWENINKYFKKAKESNKKRPENAKTCPYFHHLNALYKEGLLGGSTGGGVNCGGGSSISSKHLMVTEKGEELSEDVIDQGVNTSKYNAEESGPVQEGDSVMVPVGNEMNGSGSSNLPLPATASAIHSTSAVKGVTWRIMQE
ncbi:hypothetical protein GOP47_0000819 [Adiantum capillus-veneris]|uniref:Myb-like domain-containing protein n=1 Tax=Adiantum capillus-veneris TaxID=13818 RepID=A0A9D4VEN8_ADICA|nr:hypothetical protein GOP47_0000819 [Adiantum capillus-veneris]